ncbi:MULTISPECIES: substrate-binding domain-containing protein [unclassified Mesorhizobium]|uniref:LacI family DNA-binding transcriptional regulator n=1 Tax=unclassified Mesorhizobium TaxID=325217 RepID=UPI00112CBE22|nr:MULTISPECIES: substrate-binding domain-containing protein [unclassified Mesorhizobium]MBZ9961413.1 substrate-binding domain-containing protein [Mesorhizobium sp. BR1-1-14]TPI51980.1 LacI family DNA-binding transcriptional regulator [Mesorhizobium sp. B3-1-1]TPJ63336.1 LacI family DNA-binding transcriptional regulator [Mesorhizobium sp. B2-6-7]TPJ83571.1 LacI family DNA-binding transcriptional regulator [Mesorhizobium sp. B2-6-3]TPJ94701.1 LacI family DNA-binding transcriptional regulator [M
MTTPRGRIGFSSAQQVAELAGVSRSAVSRTFTPGASVSEETRERVLLAAEQLGYHVNHLARGLMRASTGIVCLVVADGDTPYQARILRALTQHLRDAGKVAMVFNTSGPSHHVDQALRNTLNYRADATIVLSGTPPQELIRTCLENGQRLILINRDDRFDGPHNIGVDNAAAAEAALHAFIRAGCTRPALVTSAAGTPSLVARETAFLAAARKEGLEVIQWREGRTGYATGAEGARRLLSGRQRPDAAFCVTDLIACGFLDAARHEFGVDVPRDLCVAGFDDIEQADWASYRLTTFAPPIEEIATHAVRLAAGSREEAGAGSRLTCHAPMVWRGTVRPGRG